MSTITVAGSAPNNYSREELVRAAARVPGLMSDERAVLVHLADCADQGSRRAARSIPQLAQYALISMRQCYRVLAGLRKYKLIHPVGKTRNQTRIYELTLENTG
jgi:hypothetical protein